jgi:hypothetical protein
MDPKKRKKKSGLLFEVLGVVATVFRFRSRSGGRSSYGNYTICSGFRVFISFIAGMGEILGQAYGRYRLYRLPNEEVLDEMFIDMRQLLSIPFLAFDDASIWQVALVLILLELVGKSIPPLRKSALVCHHLAICSGKRR